MEVLRIELRKEARLLGADLRQHTTRDRAAVGVAPRALLEALEPIEDVPRPAAELAEFAIAHDVNAGLGLLAHDLHDRFLQAGVERSAVHAHATLDGGNVVLKLRRPHEAADMSGANALFSRHDWIPGTGAERLEFTRAQLRSSVTNARALT
jgi:hypothetical protein